MRMFCRLIVMLAALAASPVFAQTILQGGPTIQNHIPQYSSSGNMQPSVIDGGGSGGGALGYNPSEIGITAISPTGVYPVANGGNGPNHEHGCFYDAPTTNPTGYHYLCLDPNALGGGLLSYGSGGGAAVLPFSQIINGVSYTFAGVPSSLPNLTYMSIVLGVLQHDYDTYAPIAGYIAQGSITAPITTNGGTFSITRYENMPFNSCGGNLNDTECNAALDVIVNAGTSDNMVLSGVNITAIGGSTVTEANVQALNVHSQYTGTNATNSSEGAYIEGSRSATSPGRAIGAEITAWNRGAEACAVRYGAAGIAGGTGDCDGVLFAARETITGYPVASAAHITIGSNGSQWQEGVTVNAGAVKNVAFNDQSSATYTLQNLNAGLTAGGVLVLGTPTVPTIGNISALDAVQAYSAADNGAAVVAGQFTADTNGPIFDLYKSRATTIGGHATVVSNDNLGLINFIADDGTNAVASSSIQGYVMGTVSTAIVPGQLQFRTANTSGTLTIAELIDDAQNIFVGSAGTIKIADASGNLYGQTITAATAGSSSAAGLQLGAANSGLYNSGGIAFTYGGTNCLTVTGGSVLIKCNATDTGNMTVGSLTGLVAGGDTAHAYCVSSTASFCIYYGSGAPTITAAQGSLYMRSDGSSTSTRLYVNTTGSTAWTNFTSGS